MSLTWRRWFALAGIAVSMAVYAWGLVGLPRFGNARQPYGLLLNGITVELRHATDVVTAVNFDFRGFDTVGEEFIFFASVMGTLVLLRQMADESKQSSEDQTPRRGKLPTTSDAVRGLGLLLTGPTVLFGLYIVLHGQLTPGGGFQGGVILATAPLLIYLAAEYHMFQRITSRPLLEAAEAAGAAGFVLIGLAGGIFGGVFLSNFLPAGTVGAINSGGTMPLISFSVGVEIASGFVLLLAAFLEQTLQIRLKGES